MTTTTATARIVITVPLPDRALCGNGRASGFALTRLRNLQRQDAALCAYAALAALPETLTGPLFPGGRVLVTAHVQRSQMWATRRLDDDNFWRGMKSDLDGFADAGVVANDRQFQLGAVSWERAWHRPGGVTLTLTAEEGR